MKKALFRIEANGSDITNLIKDRFIDLTVTDAAGEDSDTFSLTLDNRDDKLEFQATGDTLRIWIGLEGDALTDKGTYTIDEWTEGLEDGVVEVSGKASNMKATLKTQKTRTHEGITLGALTAKIAGEHGYSSAVHADLAGIHLGHLNQTGESDMNLLTRLCRDHGAFMKVTDGVMTVLPSDKAQTASGASLPVFVIDDPTESSGRVTLQERGSFGAVTVSYFDASAQQTVNVTVKGKDPKAPTTQLKGSYRNADEAGAAALAHINKAQRGKAVMSLDRPLTPGIIAPGKVRVTGHRKSANGEWFVDSATHTVGSSGASSTSLSLTTEQQG
ncbi:MAG: contractile injection system protein, VgrG/Pvc8 family [Aeromonadaceae bacterium]